MRTLVLLLSTASVCLALAGRGSTPVVLNVTHARSQPSHPMKFDQLTMWCAPDNQQVTLKSAYFLRRKDNHKLPATIAATKKNATLTLKEPTIEDAGEYICEMETERNGKLLYYTNIYLRPVVISDEHFGQNENDMFFLKAPSQAVVVETEVNLTCPAMGHPPPKFKWTKDGRPLEMGGGVVLDGNTIRFKNLDYSHAGKYSCEVVNEYPKTERNSGVRKVKTLLTIERDLRVKSQFAWVYPLVIIIIIFILLTVIIVFCEMRKKSLSRKSLYVAQE